MESGSPGIRNVRPAILVAASHSGAGKTTTVAILLRALRDRGLTVQAFKIGPDFIDTAYHTEATGRPAINLDLWMMGPDAIRRSFHNFSTGADISVIESMGALFDGADGTEVGSAAHLAKLLHVPVVVVLDVWGMTRTTGAVLAGMRDFDPDLTVAGCILNRTGSQRHAQMVLDSLRPELRDLVVGTVSYQAGLAVPERHLGLLTVEENPTSRAERDDAQRRAGADLDIDRLLAVAGGRATEPADITEPADTAPAAPAPARARLAVARDAAFCFYYEENLRVLRAAGFELVPFRPTSDPALPDGTDAVYIGGGYPESFAAELAANTGLAGELRRRATTGTPIYAECGGLMYLADSLTGYDGTLHPMTGILPLDVVMDPAHLAIRYVEVRTRQDSPLGPAGTTLRGQEFHQSRIAGTATLPHLFDVTSSDGATSVAGYAVGNVVASYIHVHLASNPQVARRLLGAALAARGEQA
ncbi:cobyrinate a,c-diamide synthase [Micromonospora sp. CPCC 206060]|uniref:cobyrinate a,c-diamide synthase n=1 Tax=Micromonospora sp. CPCC 206060 TaxID=3122406 RepID=UPI002FF11927